MRSVHIISIGGLVVLLAATPSRPTVDAPPPAPVSSTSTNGAIVIPRPKSMTLLPYSMPLTSSTQLCLVTGDEEAGRAIQREVERYSEFQMSTSSKLSTAHAIILGVASNPSLADLLQRDGITPPSKPEGYVLDVQPACTIVAGTDPAGVFYGAQTLCQLIRPHDGHILNVIGASVDDYPSLPFRGAHLFCGVNALPFHQRLIDNIFARFKMNNLVLQCEQAKWDALGKAAPPWAMPKPLLVQDVDNARAHFITVTPLVESVGHMEWLLKTNPTLAEDPARPYAAAVGNQETDRKLFAVLDEVVDTLHPSTLHIGGDEVVMRGRYPYASRSAYLGAANTCTAQMTKLHDYLAKKNVKTMMWADMLLPKGDDPETASSLPSPDADVIRASLPKDITLVDWHYAAALTYPTVGRLRNAGYANVIGSTWTDPINIQNFSQSTASAGGEGILQTTWAGYESTERNLNHEKAQFVAFILAAEESWNGGAVDVNHLGYDPANVFDEVYNLPPYQ